MFSIHRVGVQIHTNTIYVWAQERIMAYRKSICTLRNSPIRQNSAVGEILRGSGCVNSVKPPNLSFHFFIRISSENGGSESRH